MKNNDLHVIFSHGKESGPWGTKIKVMAGAVKQEFDCNVDSIDYQGIASPEQRVERLIERLNNLKGDIVLVGSSMGGYVSTIASNHINIKGLMLLAPAFYLPGYDCLPETNCKNISIIHGWDDEVVPFQNSINFAEKYKAKLTLINDGHRLSDDLELLASELMAVIYSSRNLDAS